MSLETYNDDTTPAICNSCLGSNPYLTLIRNKNGAECKICSRPFTVFKWIPVKNSKTFKKTVICLTCSRAKNCCQSCILDLNFNIDLNLRDNLLNNLNLSNFKNLSGEQDIVTNSKNLTSKIYNSKLLEQKFKNKTIDEVTENDKHVVIENLKQFIDTKDSKHEEGGRGGRTETNRHNNKDSKISNNELLKLIKNFPFNGNLSAVPKNENIKSYFLFGVNSNTPIYLIKEYFLNILNENSKHSSSVESVFTNEIGKFGFIEFSNRSIAEKISKIIYSHQLNEINKDTGQNLSIYNKPCLIFINNVPIRISWANKIITTGTSYSNMELSKIRQIVDKQLIKFAEYDKSKISNVKVNSGNININNSNASHNKTDKTDKNPGKIIKPKKEIKAKSNTKYKSLESNFEI